MNWDWDGSDTYSCSTDLSGGGYWTNLDATWTIPVFFWFYVLIPWVSKGVKSLRSAVIFLVITCIVRHMIGALGIDGVSAFKNLPFFALGICVFFVEKEHKENVFILLISILLTAMTALRSGDKTIYVLLFTVVVIVMNKINFPEWVS